MFFSLVITVMVTAIQASMLLYIIYTLNISVGSGFIFTQSVELLRTGSRVFDDAQGRKTLKCYLKLGLFVEHCPSVNIISSCTLESGKKKQSVNVVAQSADRPWHGWRSAFIMGFI